jgi:hypothetical protein
VFDAEPGGLRLQPASIHIPVMVQDTRVGLAGNHAAASPITASSTTRYRSGEGAQPTLGAGKGAQESMYEVIERMFETRCPDGKTTVALPALPGDAECPRAASGSTSPTPRDIGRYPETLSLSHRSA